MRRRSRRSPTRGAILKREGDKPSFFVSFACWDSHDSDFILKSSRFSPPLALNYPNYHCFYIHAKRYLIVLLLANGVLHPRSHFKREGDKPSFFVSFACWDSHDSDFILKSSRFSPPLALNYPNYHCFYIHAKRYLIVLLLANGVLHPRSHFKREGDKPSFFVSFACWDSHDSDFILKSSRFFPPLDFVCFNFLDTKNEISYIDTFTDIKTHIQQYIEHKRHKL